MSKNPPKTINHKQIHKARTFIVREDTVVLSNGENSTYTVLDHPGAAVILPMHSNGDLVLVKQWRHAPQLEMYEFPAGTLENGEAPIECAKREIIEETSFSAKEWISLGELLPAPGFANEKQYLYLARDLEPREGELDEDEIIEVVRMSQAEVLELVKNGSFLDGKSLSILLRAITQGFISI